MLNRKSFIFNPFAENTYVLWDDRGDALILDAGGYAPTERRELEQWIHAEGLTPRMVLCTHGHIDHILGVEALKQAFGIPFALHGADRFLVDSAREHGAIYGFEVGKTPAVEVDLASLPAVDLGGLKLQILHTPGHTPGHVCLWEPQGRQLFTGDTLFRESIGRTDLPGGDYSWIMRSILDQLMPLGGDVEFFPGHGSASTLGHEALYNPFITEVLNGQVCA